MPRLPQTPPPPDAAARRAAKPVVVYAVDRLPVYDAAFYDNARSGMTKIGETIVPPREGRAFDVPAGHFFRILSIEGPQVGDLNLWNAANLAERFFSGKTRALNATHVSTGDRLWSALPYLRPMATITRDTLDWYGFDADGAGVHDVIGTRCDPYTNRLLNRRRLSSLLPFEPDAGARGADEHIASRGGAARPRRAQRLHVHGLHARFPPLLHEGEPGAAGRFHRILRRDRSHRRVVGVPGRRLRRYPFQRRGALPSFEGRDLPPARGGLARLAAARGQRLFGA